jgi:16S rRNA (guanine1516-N2)-methyltransferase
VNSTIAIVALHPQAVTKAQALAHQLQLPYLADTTAPEDLPPYLLVVAPHQLAVQKTGSRMQALSVDFASSALQYRVKTTGYQTPLAKAVGINSKNKPHVLDLSAGLGRDAFILATLGAHVQLIERHPIVAALLADGLERARALPHLAPVIARMTLFTADGQHYIQQLPADHSFDVVYFDPMFPIRQKSALVKKEMQILQGLLDVDLDADSMLALARSKARKRVVIKRPQGAPFLAGVEPDFTLNSKGLRFDVYIPLAPQDASI